jgi:hypothetical protein
MDNLRKAMANAQDEYCTETKACACESESKSSGFLRIDYEAGLCTKFLLLIINRPLFLAKSDKNHSVLDMDKNF